MGADAAVGAGPEGQVPVVGPVIDEVVGVGEGVRIPIGRRPRQRYLGAGRQRNPADDRVAGHRAGEVLDRGLQPQRLLDGGKAQLRLGDDRRPDLRLVGQPEQQGADRPHRRLVPRHRHQEGDAEQLVLGQRPAVELQLHDAGQHVVAGVVPPVLQRLEQIAEQLQGLLGVDLAVLVGRRLQHHLRQFPVVLPVRLREAQHAGDHDRGDGHRQLHGQVGMAPVDEGVDLPVDDRPDVGLQRQRRRR